MNTKVRRFTGIAAAVVAVSAAIPASTAMGAAAAPCRAVSQSTGSEVAIVLQGQFADKDGGDVTLTCHLVQNGVKVVSVTDPLVGPVAALASDQRLGTASFRVCHTVSVQHINPWGPYYYDSNC